MLSNDCINIDYASGYSMNSIQHESKIHMLEMSKSLQPLNYESIENIGSCCLFK